MSARVDGPGPSILRMAAPLMVSFVMRAAFSLVDTVYAATIGDAAVAAVGLTAPFEFLMIAVWVGLSTGLTSALSRAMASREPRKIEQYLRASWRLVRLASPAFLALGLAIWPLAPRLGLRHDVARSFQIYSSVLVGGSALTMFWSVIPDSLVKAHQDTRSTMCAGICSNVINVALNTLFVFGFEWGVLGIALSTVVGRIGGLVYAAAKSAEHERRRRAAWGELPAVPDARPYGRILGLAVPSSLTFTLMSLESAIVNGLLARLEHPTEAIAAYSIYYRVALFAFNPVIATAVAMLPYAARRLGNGDIAGVRRGLREAILAMSLYCVVLVGPVMLVAAPALARSLAESALSERYTTAALRLVPLACLLGAPFLLCRPVFEGMQRGGPGLVMAGVRYLGLTVPLAWIGIEIGAGVGWPALYGLLTGLLAASGLSSAAFAVWLGRGLAAAERLRAA